LRRGPRSSSSSHLLAFAWTLPPIMLIHFAPGPRMTPARWILHHRRSRQLPAPPRRSHSRPWAAHSRGHKRWPAGAGQDIRPHHVCQSVHRFKNVNLAASPFATTNKQESYRLVTHHCWCSLGLGYLQVSATSLIHFWSSKGIVVI
jgi:hypothetical protein